MIKVNKPKIRFKKFNDSWSVKKLSDTQTCFKDGNYGEAYPKETDLTSSTQGIPFLRGSDLDNGKLTLTNARYITHSKHSELVSGHLIEDDIVIAVRGSLGSLGYVGPESVGWNINSQLAIIRTRKIEIIGNYLIQFLLSHRGSKEILSHITGTALKQLPIKQLKNIKIPIPILTEQQSIGLLFRTLDDLLSNYKDNLANYQSLKATMLSNMFPKAGQTVPEMRLDGFEGEWENIRLGDCAIIKGRLGWKSLKQEEYTEVGPSMIAGKHIKNGVIDWGEVDHIPQWRYDESPDIMLENGDIIFSKDGSLGNPALVSNLKGEATINSTMMLVRLDKKISSQFFYQVLTSSVFQKLIYLKVSGSSIPHLFQADMQDFKFYAPSIEEQRAIGLYFSNLDNLINSHQEKISQLETLKKKLLQDMFI